MSTGFNEFTRAAVQPQYAWTRPEGGMANVRLQQGDSVVSFRGEQWFFEGVSQHAVGNSAGRVSVSRLCADAYTTSNGQQDCPHMWHRNGIERQDFFPSVFGLYLGNAEGAEA
jgi:hypothetical protein